MTTKPITEEQFKEQMSEKYGYSDFSTLMFKASKTTLACIKCGKLNQKPARRHIECTCSDCFSNMSQRSDNSDFIEKVENKFGKGTFSFDKLNYVNAKTPVILYCNVHQGEINIVPNKLLTSKGCNHCNKNHAYTTETFIEKCESNYGKQFTFEHTKYVNQKTKVIIHCTKCDNDWVVDPKTIIVGKTGCGECSNKAQRTTEKFVTLAKAVHGDRYDYSTVDYVSSEDKVEIRCIKHGIFAQQPKAHLTGRGCPKCGKYGYQPQEPGTFYIQKLVSTEKVLYKFGISGNLERRVYEQSRTSIYEHELVVRLDFEDGKIPLEIENAIKEKFTTGLITENELSSGYTETISEEDYESVLKLLYEMGYDV